MKLSALLEQQFELPSIPKVVALLLNELDRPEIDLKKVTQLISTDPALTTRLLRVANSDAFGLSGKISSVSEALAVYGLPPVVYAAGRLDHDSEGLLLLTDHGTLAHKLTDPKHKADKTYWVQVEGSPSDEQLQQLRAGVVLNDGPTLPAKIECLDPAPSLWTRDPPVRFRKTVPDSWLAITIREGRNRQVRRMTAAVNLPTLRLVRVAMGPYRLDDLQPGQWRQIG